MFSRKYEAPGGSNLTDMSAIQEPTIIIIIRRLNKYQERGLQMLLMMHKNMILDLPVCFFISRLKDVKLIHWNLVPKRFIDLYVI